ncbi:MAG: hypothetical protein ACOZCL_02070 [Bacillota bacterium]
MKAGLLDELVSIVEKDIRGIDYYGVVIIDIDFLIRFCRRFDKADMKAIMNNIDKFFVNRLPKNGILTKTNSDEYLLCIKDMKKEAILDYVAELKKEFRKQRFAQETNKEYSNIAMTFSAGIADYTYNDDSLYEIVRKATTALFMAKAFRRNRIYFAPDAGKIGKNRVLLDEDLKISVLIGDYGKIGFCSRPTVPEEAQLWEPQAIDVDSNGYLYIVDQNNHAILKYDGQHVYTIAGKGSFGYSGDGSDSLFAELNKPTGLAIHENDLYITDTGNDVVRKIDLSTGVITTVAGNGVAGYSGDGGAATNAQLNKPGGIAIDEHGCMYINDIANNVIRKVDKKGIITTYAGTGEYGYSGDGESAEKARFAEIYGIGINKKTNDIYLADYFNHCIRKIDFKTGIISTVAGNGKEGYIGDGMDALDSSLSRPVAVYFDKNDNLYIAESGNSCIRFVRHKTNKIYTLVGDGEYGIGSSGKAANFRLANPNGIAITADNQIYILDGANNRVCHAFITFD